MSPLPTRLTPSSTSIVSSRCPFQVLGQIRKPCSAHRPPNTQSLRFHPDYLKTHMPLVQEKWGPSGMTDYNVLQYKAAADGSPSPFSVGATLRFESVEAFENVSAPPGPDGHREKRFEETKTTTYVNRTK